MYIIAQMTPSEREFAEDTFGKPVEKLTTAQLEREWKAIRSTYPEEKW
jgi:hypothetical protein